MFWGFWRASFFTSLTKNLHSNSCEKISGVSRGVWGVSKPPLPKLQRPSKIVANSTRLWKLLKIVEFRTPTPQDDRKKRSKILKLPPVRNCFTLTMTNKLVVIINSLKVTKTKKILLYEMKFLVPNYSCLQNPWPGGSRPQIPVLSVLCPQLNLLNPPTPEQSSCVRHWIISTLRALKENRGSEQRRGEFWTRCNLETGVFLHVSPVHSATFYILRFKNSASFNIHVRITNRIQILFLYLFHLSSMPVPVAARSKV